MSATARKKVPLPDDDGREFLSPKFAATFLRCSRNRIFYLRTKGYLPNQREWTREQLRAAAKRCAEEPARRKGEKAEPKKEQESAPPPPPPKESKRGVDVTTPPPAAPKPKEPEKPAKGFLDRIADEIL